MLGLIIGIYVATGWVGAIAVGKLAKDEKARIKQEQKEADFMALCNAGLKAARKEGSKGFCAENIFTAGGTYDERRDALQFLVREGFLYQRPSDKYHYFLVKNRDK